MFKDLGTRIQQEYLPLFVGGAIAKTFEPLGAWTLQQIGLREQVQKIPYLGKASGSLSSLAFASLIHIGLDKGGVYKKAPALEQWVKAGLAASVVSLGSNTLGAFSSEFVAGQLGLQMSGVMFTPKMGGVMFTPKMSGVQFTPTMRGAPQLGRADFGRADFGRMGEYEESPADFGQVREDEEPDLSVEGQMG